MAGWCQSCFHPQGIHATLDGGCIACGCKQYKEYAPPKIRNEKGRMVR